MLSSDRRSSSGLTRFCRIALPGVVLLGSVLSAREPPTPPQGARLRQINSIAGKDLFKAYCAQCHGETGKGDGPRAAGLRTPAPDLTQIAVRNGGTFSRKGVERFISGDRPRTTLEMDARGEPVLMKDGVPDEMPVWGTLFRYMWPDQPIQIRTGNLAKYLEEIQVK